MAVVSMAALDGGNFNFTSVDAPSAAVPMRAADSVSDGGGSGPFSRTAGDDRCRMEESDVTSTSLPSSCALVAEEDVAVTDGTLMD